MPEVRWANSLREWREVAGLTTKEAASGLRVSEYRYEQWELGIQEPTATPLMNMPRVFGVAKREVFKTVEVEAA